MLLRSGDFVDGEFAGLKDGRITISSVLFGKKEFVVEEEAVAVVFHPVRKRTAAFEVHCADGSVLRVSGLKLAPPGREWTCWLRVNLWSPQKLILYSQFV